MDQENLTMSQWQYYFLVFLYVILAGNVIGQSPVIINEIHYNPPDLGIEDGLFREFIELHNPSPDTVTVGGCYFDDSIRYTFPEDTVIHPGEYLVLAKDIDHPIWDNRPYRILGPYDGRLDNGGERITLRNVLGQIIETLRYNDVPPWPRGADGYDASLERVDHGATTQHLGEQRTSLRSGSSSAR